MEYVIAIKNTSDLHPLILALAESEKGGTKKADLFFSEPAAEHYIMKRWQSNDESLARVLEANPAAKKFYNGMSVTIRNNYAVMVKVIDDNDSLGDFLQTFASNNPKFIILSLT
jgi:F0F1-type ATP synthase delta subunit